MAAFSFDEFFDPLISDGFDQIAEKLPRVFRGAANRLRDELIRISLDDAARAIVERILDAWFSDDSEPPLVGFALSHMSEEDEAALQQVGLDPLTILTLIQFAASVIEFIRPWLRGQAAVAVAGDRPELTAESLQAALAQAG